MNPQGSAPVDDETDESQALRSDSTNPTAADTVAKRAESMAHILGTIRTILLQLKQQAQRPP